VRLFVANALERRHLSRENIALKQQLGVRYGFENLIGSDPRMLEIYELIRQVANTPTTLLITGETGSGKELVARAVHVNGARKREPFVVINCGAIPAELLESELFGHKRGSFTGAVSDKKGLFEIASGGTIFLDEVGELPQALQVKLLRVLQQRVILPVGAVRDVPIDVRLISATNRSLEKDVAAGRFRDDLFYRLNVIQIQVPPLRERRGDIPILAEYFLEKYTRLLGKNIRKISVDAMSHLNGYRFPGNVRELENIVERAVALEKTDVIMPESLPAGVLRPEADRAGDKRRLFVSRQGVDLDGILAETEKELIGQAMNLSGGGKKDAAKLLGITFRSLRYRLVKLGIEGPDSRDDLEDDGA